MVKATLKIQGRTYKNEGKTAEKAILGLEPEMTRSMGLLVVSNGKVTKEKVLTKNLIFQLFGKSGRIQKEMATKNMKLLFPNTIFE